MTVDLFFENQLYMMKKLLNYKVDFVMIGGHILNYYELNNPKRDLVLLLKPTNENKLKYLTMMQNIHFDKKSIAIVESLDFTKPGLFCLGDGPKRVVFITHIRDESYEEIDKKKIITYIKGMFIPVLQLNPHKLAGVLN